MYHARYREFSLTLALIRVRIVGATSWQTCRAMTLFRPWFSLLIWITLVSRRWKAVEVGDDDELIVAEPRGGLGARAYDTGTGVRIISRDGAMIYGTIESHGLLRRVGRFARTDRVMIRPESGAFVRRASDLTYPAAVVLDLPSFSIEGDFIHARQIDDLAGCAAILTSLIEVSKDGSNTRPIVGLFTRAEEVGLVGAALAASDELVSKDAIVVSVETSLKSDNAKQGEGIVIRVGDRMTTFDHEAEAVLHAATHRVNERDDTNGFKVQRALMGAGGCEASAFKAHGYKVTGTSFPLGAWHNTEDDGSIIPEYIHVDDFRSGVALITESMRDDGEPRQNDPLRYSSFVPGNRCDAVARGRISRMPCWIDAVYGELSQPMTKIGFESAI